MIRESTLVRKSVAHIRRKRDTNWKKSDTDVDFKNLAKTKINENENLFRRV